MLYWRTSTVVYGTIGGVTPTPQQLHRALVGPSISVVSEIRLNMRAIWQFTSLWSVLTYRILTIRAVVLIVPYKHKLAFLDSKSVPILSAYTFVHMSLYSSSTYAVNATMLVIAVRTVIPGLDKLQVKEGNVGHDILPGDTNVIHRRFPLTTRCQAPQIHQIHETMG